MNAVVKTETGTAVAKYSVDANIAVVAELIAEVAGPEGINPNTDLDRVHIPAGGSLAWEVPTLKGPDTVETIEGVIIHQADARAYWSAEMGEGEGNSPPDCASPDGQFGTGDPGGYCQLCSFAQFKSDANGRGQACKALKILYVMTPGRKMPLAITLSPSSIKAARAYLLHLAGSGLRASQVETKLSLVSDKNTDGITYSKAVLEMGEVLSEETAAWMKAYGDALRPVLALASGAAVA